ALNTGTQPSSLSKDVVTGLLKEKMEFEGLVFTDALVMKGARQDGKANGLAAFKAGNDVLLEPYKLDQSVKDLIAYYNNSEEG
ncbi:glycoside hydrolase family 3 N-terminal domain-containing protein, partial [Acinetobacter sp. 163]|nr:glycoside hydrolase family 3 N-terminal domain-containing protein [Acinetobacter sp. 163]